MSFLFGKPKRSNKEKRLFKHWHEFTTQTSYQLDHIHFMYGAFFASMRRDEDEAPDFVEKLRDDLRLHQLRAQIISDKFRHTLRVELR